MVFSTYQYKGETYHRLHPDEPRVFCCPDCMANREPYRLRFKHSVDDVWGTVESRFDVYRCRNCREWWVSTNGERPEVAADWLRF